MDVIARSDAPVLPATSNPGRTAASPGGVGRNIAEVMARLGSNVALVSRVGDDALGTELLAHTQSAGVDVSTTLRTPGATGTYTAILDSDGELMVAVSDMRATDQFSAADVRRHAATLHAADLVVLDANLPSEALAAATETPAPIVVEPVSVPKARRLLPLLDVGVDWLALTPNRDELAALTATSDPEQGARLLHERGVQHVWVSLGADGSVLSSADGEVRRIRAYPATAADVTGAGDALVGGFCSALLRGVPVLDAARWGHAAAALTVEAPAAVRADLTEALLRERMSA